jgi:hypothetical protein
MALIRHNTILLLIAFLASLLSCFSSLPSGCHLRQPWLSRTRSRKTPGKLTSQRGLSRLLDMLATQAVLAQYEATHHGLTPQIAAFLRNGGHLTSYD